MTETKEKYTVTEQNAAKIWLWLQTRGGIATWPSINLSNPGESWTTPATHDDGSPATKPTWQADDKPIITTDVADVFVSIDVEVKRFRVGVYQTGMALKVTAGGSRRIRREVAKAGDGAWYTFDYENQEAVIMKPTSVVPITDYIAAHPQATA